VELHLQFGALERLLRRATLREDGRRYMHGNQKASVVLPIWNSRTSRANAGRLRIQAKFTGRSAMNVFGQCVGFGDAFDLTILATPAIPSRRHRPQGRVSTDRWKASFYIRRVCAAIAASLGRDFRYPMEIRNAEVIEDPASIPGTSATCGFQRARNPRDRRCLGDLVIIFNNGTIEALYEYKA